MERQTKQNARRKHAVLTPVNEQQLQAFLSSEGSRLNDFVARMAETLRQAWVRIEELQGDPPQPTNEERDYKTSEKVLVISETDGAVEVFAEPWVKVAHLSVLPWQNREQAVLTLKEEFRALETAPKSKALIVPQIRPVLDDRVLLDLLRWERRAAVLEELRDVIARRV